MKTDKIHDADDAKAPEPIFAPLGDADKEKIKKLAAQLSAQLGDEGVSPVIMTGLIRLVDFCLLALSGLTIQLIYVLPRSGFSFGYLLTILMGSALAVLAFQIADTYQIQSLRSPLRNIPRIIIGWLIAFSAMAVLAFFLKIGSSFSRVWFGTWFVTGLATLVIWRHFVAFSIRRWVRDGTMERRAIIVGGGQPAEKLIRSLEKQPENDVRICGIFDDRDNRRSPPIVAGYPKLGNISELVEFARLVRIDMLILTLPLTAEKRVAQLLKKLWVLPVDIRLAAHSSELRFRPRAYSSIGTVQLLDLLDRPITDWDSVAKRAFDIFFSVMGILLLWPIMLAAAIAVKATSMGPIIFTQKRHGFNNETINVHKFRSMYVDQSDQTAINPVTKDDPRVTPVGRFLRRTSIDELPQFFNVLKGDLSLVGPRPHAVHARSHDRIFNEIVEEYFGRHKVKPGVTGWAQINGWRGEIDSDEKIRQRTAFDLYYIENWSLLFDLKILFLTPINLIKGVNAY